jgi:hypothetical protein
LRKSSTDVVPGNLAREVSEVRRVGAGEGVDGLGGVAHDADLVAAAEPQVEQCGLDRRDVLELVDDEPLVLRADLGGDALLLGEHPGGEEEDVLHVHPRLGALHLLVPGEEPADGLVVEARDRSAVPAGEPGVVVRADVADLGPLDLGREIAQEGLVGRHPEPPGGPGQERDLGLGQGRQVAAVRRGPEPPQLPERGTVEGAGLHARSAESVEPGAHLAGRPGRERDGEHLGRGVDAPRPRHGRCGG